MEHCDLFVFGGQSNMAGRGEAEKAPKIGKNVGVEFRVISDPTKFHTIVEPFGVNENNSKGIFEPNMKTGSLVSSYAKKYHELSGRKIIGISASKGGSNIAQWQPGQLLLCDLLYRLDRTKYWLHENKVRIDHIFLLWLQGETDGDLKTSPEDYISMTRQTFDEIKKHGVEHIFMIQIGNQRDDPILYKPIQEAQSKMALCYVDITIVSTCLKTMGGRGMMKDKFHYCQEAYNECGEEAASNTIGYLIKQSII